MTTVERRDDGYTLTEVLVATVILGICVVALLGALASGIFQSRVHREIVRSDAIARSAAEQILASTYVHCATPASYQTALNPAPDWQGWTVTVTSVEWLDGNNPPGVTATCTQSPTPTATDSGVERISIRVRRPTSSTASQQDITFLKRAS
jgi:prepilin-type N-terminal cleavage/methylation domain-containing protein